MNMDNLLKEKSFEDAIEKFLVTEGGYQKGDANSFDRVLALDTDTLLSFVQTSQPKKWEKYILVYGSEAPNAFVRRFDKEVASRGLLDVLRKGFKDRGIEFRVCFFKPETSINEETIKKYNQNILHCTRQLHYSVINKNSVDIVLFLNGIPVVSMELKCQFTGQTAMYAINQYKFDRASKDKVFEFRNRVLVHFAVDLYEIYMTTQLEGAETYFLPFNKGSNGAGNVGGKGNPYIENDYQTSYLWKEVLVKDRLMEILHKYMHLLKEEKINDKGDKYSKEAMIFPRYHQLDVVTNLLADVKKNGPGKNYLIQHSAGSGKSNSIAWLAHRLSGLHNENDEKIFQSIIVVTDRKVLDSQLQATIYQFDHVLGVVECIDDKKHAVDLRDAINAGKQIIITTLQKFPIICREVESEKRNFAVIVDEAHSSQTGEESKKLKIALGDTEDILDKYRAMEADNEASKKDYEDNMVEEMAAHGKLDNLSFFAFTATPKEKTLQMFGEKIPSSEIGGKPNFRAFHLYSMRQAIEEGFILDVLKNYTTYEMFYKVIKKVADDPEVDPGRAAKEIARFESLHPHNIAQKTAIMVEHFRSVTKNKINGQAKAMIVTGSRLHAVRYLMEFRRYIGAKEYTDLDVLVAFSGTVRDDGAEYTEENLNKTKNGETIKESQLKSQFHTEDFNVLVVAEKYQTGFDEPLLHTMFVDKKLSGVKAVQTLSRINRTMKGKSDTFVLDFVNTVDEMKESFQPFYEATILEGETDPNIVYDLKNKLDEFHVYQPNEVERFAEAYYSKRDSDLQAILVSCIKPARERFMAIVDVQKKDEFRAILARFVRLYSFVTQICRMYDLDLQKFYNYGKFLLTCIPKDETDKIDLSDDLILE
ncbi:MAG TPA: restriction endonuclease subunit R, partial [Rikenellaceae bacterium]|nr:restriction endonuclease subunit R [Rikenellaceae bacterium]